MNSGKKRNQRNVKTHANGNCIELEWKDNGDRTSNKHCKVPVNVAKGGDSSNV